MKFLIFLSLIFVLTSFTLTLIIFRDLLICTWLYSDTHIFHLSISLQFPGQVFNVFTLLHIQGFPAAALAAPVGGPTDPPLAGLLADDPRDCPRPLVHPFLSFGGFGGAGSSSVGDDQDVDVGGDISLGGADHALPHPRVPLRQVLQQQGVDHGGLVWGLFCDDEDSYTTIGRDHLSAAQPHHAGRLVDDGRSADQRDFVTLKNHLTLVGEDLKLWQLKGSI